MRSLDICTFVFLYEQIAILDVGVTDDQIIDHDGLELGLIKILVPLVESSSEILSFFRI